MGGGVTNIPLGSIVPYSINNNLPEGFLICNGAAISRQEYADLFDLIGTTYGVGDGSTTFNVPDLRDKFLEGSTTAGINIAAGLPNITGRIWAAGNTYGAWSEKTGSFSNSISNANIGGSPKSDGYGNSIIEFDASLSNSIYGNSTTVQPPAVTVVYIIKALESDISLEHKHDLATELINGFMSKEDKSFLNSFKDRCTIIPPIFKEELNLENNYTPKQYFTAWVKYITANYYDELKMNDEYYLKYFISPSTGDGYGIMIGSIYLHSTFPIVNGMPQYMWGLFISNNLTFIRVVSNTLHYYTLNKTEVT